MNQSRALIIVDVQNDFCEGGSLAVAGGADVAKRITRHLLDHGQDYDLIVASRDWHNPYPDDNGGHFDVDPDFVNTWPTHCVADTEGAQFHANLHLPTRAHVVDKGQGKPAYSAFEGFELVEDESWNLTRLLKQHDINVVHIVGIATDFCVKATALDSDEEGYTTRVLLGLTAAVGTPTLLLAIREMEAAGIYLDGAAE